MEKPFKASGKRYIWKKPFVEDFEIVSPTVISIVICNSCALWFFPSLIFFFAFCSGSRKKEAKRKQVGRGEFGKSL